MALLWWWLLVPLVAAVDDSASERTVVDINYGERWTPGHQYSRECAAIGSLSSSLPSLLLTESGFARFFLNDTQRQVLSAGAHMWFVLNMDNSFAFHVDFDVVDPATGAVLLPCAPSCLTIEKASFRIRALNTTVVDTGPLTDRATAWWAAVSVASHEGVELLWMAHTQSYAQDEHARSAVTQALRALAEPVGTLALTLRLTREGADHCTRAPDNDHWGAAVQRVIVSSLCADASCALCRHMNRCDDTHCDDRGCAECRHGFDLLPQANEDAPPICYPQERFDHCQQSWTALSCAGQGRACRWCALREACVNATERCPSECASEPEDSCNTTHWCQWQSPGRCEAFGPHKANATANNSGAVVWERNYSLPDSTEDAVLSQSRLAQPRLQIGDGGIVSYVVNGSETHSLLNGFEWSSSVSLSSVGARVLVRFSTRTDGGEEAECVPLCLELGDPMRVTVGNTTRGMLGIPYAPEMLFDLAVLVQEDSVTVFFNGHPWAEQMDNSGALRLVGLADSIALSVLLEVVGMVIARHCLVDNCRACSVPSSCSECDGGYARVLTRDSAAFVCVDICHDAETEAACRNTCEEQHEPISSYSSSERGPSAEGGRSLWKVVAIVSSFATAGPIVAVAAGASVFLVGRGVINKSKSKGVKLLPK
eukprot:m51a1_g1725 hypothetical protein (654) ;mRNA; r:116879-119165